MGKKAKVRWLAGILSSVFLCGIVLTSPPPAPAQQPKATAEGVSYNVNGSMLDNLKSLVGKKVSVTLTSGKTYTGIVKDVGSHLVHVEKLEGREYFDALILLEKIEAVDARARGEQR